MKIEYAKPAMQGGTMQLMAVGDDSSPSVDKLSLLIAGVVAFVALKMPRYKNILNATLYAFAGYQIGKLIQGK